MTVKPKTRRSACGRKKSQGRPGLGTPRPKFETEPRVSDEAEDGRMAGRRRDALSAYFQDVGPVSSVLSPAKEREMAERIRRGVDASAIALKKALPAAERYRDWEPAQRTARVPDRIAKAKALLSRFNPDGLADAKLRAHVDEGMRGGFGLAGLAWHDPEGYRVAERFIQANLRLVIQLAKRFAHHGYMPLEDLIQEGNDGLVKAVLRFDERKGFRFSTYGTWWIRHAMGRGMADKARTIRLPVHMIDLKQKVDRARRELIDLHGRLPTDDELAKAARIPKKKLELLQRALHDPFSLEDPLGDEDGHTFGDLIASEPSDDPEWKSIVPGKDVGALHQALSELPVVMREVLLLRFDFIEKPGDGVGKDAEWTLREIGEKYRLSRERIRQLQEAGIKRLRIKLVDRHAAP